jgi:hypothetical protein
LATLERRRASRAPHARYQEKNREESEQTSYSQYRHAKAETLFPTLPEAEQAEIEAIARGRSSKGFTGAGEGSFSTRIFEAEKARVIAERHPAHIPTFADRREVERETTRYINEGKTTGQHIPKMSRCRSRAIDRFRQIEHDRRSRRRKHAMSVQGRHSARI